MQNVVLGSAMIEEDSIQLKREYCSSNEGAIVLPVEHDLVNHNTTQPVLGGFKKLKKLNISTT